MGLFDLFSNDTAERARDMANAGATAGYGQLSDFYGKGRTDLTQGYGAASGTYKGLMDAYQPGFAAYGDASGAGGVEGLKRATDLYHNSGQYGAYGVVNDAAQQAIQRAAAAGGQSLSGNVLDASTRKAQDLGNQYWGQFQQGLAPYMSAYGTAGAGLAGTQSGLGTALNANDIAQGNAANTTQTTIGNNNAGAELNNYKVGANQLGALVGVGQMAMGMPPTAFSSIGGGSSGGGGGGTAIGQTAGQPFNWSNTPIAQGYAGVQNLFSGFGGGNSGGGLSAGLGFNNPNMNSSYYGPLN